MEDKVSKNFTLHELTVSAKAVELGINNEATITEEVRQSLRALILNVLQPARDILGCPIKVTSGYRSPRVNQAVGGKPTSRHLKGQAADLRCFTNKVFDAARTRRLFEILSGMDVDQLLYERDSKGTIWIHVSYVSPAKNRHIINDNYIVK